MQKLLRIQIEGCSEQLVNETGDNIAESMKKFILQNSGTHNKIKTHITSSGTIKKKYWTRSINVFEDSDSKNSHASEASNEE